MKRVWMIGVLLLMIWFAPAVCAQEPDFYASSGADELFSVFGKRHFGRRQRRNAVTFVRRFLSNDRQSDCIKGERTTFFIRIRRFSRVAVRIDCKLKTPAVGECKQDV